MSNFCEASVSKLALGQILLATNDFEAALTCAKAGLEELGDEYAPFLVEDDTDLKLFLAEGRIEKGYLNEGAELMLRALETRIFLYAELHQENISGSLSFSGGLHSSPSPKGRG